MAFHIRDPEADRLVRELAALRGISMTEAVKIAARRELLRAREDSAALQSKPFRERIRDLQRRVAARSRTGEVADKAFYDRLSGEE